MEAYCPHTAVLRVQVPAAQLKHLQQIVDNFTIAGSSPVSRFCESRLMGKA